MQNHVRATVLAAAFALLAISAHAHITLEIAQASPGSACKAVLRVGHGCDGSATTAIRAQIPEGLVAVKPMPKAGWMLKTVSGPYAAGYDVFGEKISQAVRQVIWSGGNLPDDFYDEFVFRAMVAAELAGTAALCIRVVQECEKGEKRWVDVPKAGEDAAKLKEPAPKIALVAAEAAAAPAIKIGALVITRPWARATPGGAEVAGGYLRIANTGTEADLLIGGTTDIAGAVEFHDMKTVDGVMQMRELTAGLEIPAGGSVELQPGGLHVMFTHLKAPLKQGTPVKVKLLFEKAGPVEVEFAVEAIGAKGPAGPDHSAHKH